MKRVSEKFIEEYIKMCYQKILKNLSYVAHNKLNIIQTKNY